VENFYYEKIGKVNKSFPPRVTISAKH